MAIRLKDRPHPAEGEPARRLIGLSGTTLKWIGFALTCAYTLGVAVFQRGLLGIEALDGMEALSDALLAEEGGNIASAVVSCGLLSTLAIPIYGRLLYEEWKQAPGKSGLLLRLALCALAAEIPYDLAITGRPLDFNNQNPAWALLLCAVMLEIIRVQRPGSRVWSAVVRIFVVAAALAWALLLRIHLGTLFVLLTALYLFTDGSAPLIASFGGAMLTFSQFPAPLGMLLDRKSVV